jgi:hypothetical protein
MHHTTRTYIIPIATGTLMSFLALVSMLWFVDPFSAGNLQHIFFYITIFLSAAGIFTLAGIQARKKFLPGILVEQLKASFRQAMLIAVLITGLLVLQATGLLLWWVGLTLILFIITLEVFFNA